METPGHEHDPEPRARPQALTVAGWAIVVLGAVGGSLSAALAITGTNQPADPSVPEGAAFIARVIGAIFSLGLGTLIIWTGLNLLRLRRWAWITTVVLMGLGVASGLTGLITNAPALETVLRIALPATVLALTVSPPVTRMFRP